MSYVDICAPTYADAPLYWHHFRVFFFFQAEDGIRDVAVTGVQTCALPIYPDSVGLTDKAYKGDEIQYDIGVVLGTNLSEHIGVFIEGIKSNFYNKQEYSVSSGMNWRF